MLAYEILLALLIIFFIIVASYDYYEAQTGVPTFPTMPAVRRKMIELLKKDAQERGIKDYSVIDLGSGSGQLTWRLARAMPDAKFLGIELSYIPWWRSIMRQRLRGPHNLEYKRLDFWPFDISNASAIITYLPGKIMERVGQKLHKELKPGTLIIANGFYLRDGWEPLETLTVRVPFKMKVYIYRQK